MLDILLLLVVVVDEMTRRGCGGVSHQFLYSFTVKTLLAAAYLQQEDIVLPSKHGMIAGIGLLACGVITWWRLCCRGGEERSEKAYADKSFVLEHFESISLCISIIRTANNIRVLRGVSNW